MDRSTHWEGIHTSKRADEVSWHQEVPTPSLELIARCAVPPETPVIDVGGGSSTLVDHLLDSGFTDVTVLDVSEAALERARARLEDDRGRTHWIDCDVTAFTPPRQYGLWHDRAAFHFLTEEEDRRAYAAAARAAVAPGGWIVMGTFALDGPEKCSGLPVQRHDGRSIEATLGGAFELMEEQAHDHVTPGGGVQRFTFARLRKTEGAESV